MPSRSRPTIITDARYGTTLSAESRERRYLWTMAFRVVTFLVALFSPLPWNVLLFLAAALLPAIAVLLGNARDNHLEPAMDPEPDAPARPALERGEVVHGDVVEPDAMRQDVGVRPEAAR
ncbi:MAG: DUF3099 domain-containing protein [Propionibacteriaceae bacterium]|nr:DUF3099 domain-containing protein [Propionibacteriaceae bacterium]